MKQKSPRKDLVMTNDLITLRIGGVDWTYWKSVEIVRQMDAIAGAFSLTLADKWVPGAQPAGSRAQEPLPVAAGQECELLIGSDPVIRGWIDKVTPSFSASEHGISVSGRDASADLVDCSAVHSPGQWNNISCLDLAKILAKPFGIEVTAEGVLGAPLPVFKLEQGEKAFEALDRALKQRELLACPDGKGGIVLLKVGAKAHSLALRQGHNILSASAEYDLTDRFSDYLVQAQRPGNDQEWGLAACAVHAAAKDAEVRRHRPLIIRAENSADSAGAQQRAAWEKSVRAGRSVSVSVTVQGFRQGQPGDVRAPLWQINALTEVDIPFLRISQRLLCGKVTFRRDIGPGSTTTLELKDPSAFRPEPKKKEGGARDFNIEMEKGLQARQTEQAEGRQSEIKKGK
jgi:prophage tail gpP-like protein